MPAQDSLDRLVKKLESRKLDQSLTDILLKLEGDLIWTVEKSIVCRAYDRNGQVIIECGGGVQ